MRLSEGLLFSLFAGAIPLAATISFNFEAFPDSTLLAGQYSGVMFGNAIVLTAGITLDDFEFPAHSGNNVAADSGGPITITFTSPLRSFSGYFTYSVPLTIQALDASNHPIASAVSAFSNNQALSGVSGSHPDELLHVSASTSIYKIVITGAAHGTSFTVDDITAISKCDTNQDGTITVADVQVLIGEVLGQTPAIDDLDADGAVDVTDLQIAINAVLGSGCAAK